MLTFNEIKSALVENGRKVDKVHLVLADASIPIAGVYTQGIGEVWCIPLDRSGNIQVTTDHTLVVLS